MGLKSLKEFSGELSLECFQLVMPPDDWQKQMKIIWRNSNFSLGLNHQGKWTFMVKKIVKHPRRQDIINENLPEQSKQ